MVVSPPVPVEDAGSKTMVMAPDRDVLPYDTEDDDESPWRAALIGLLIGLVILGIALAAYALLSGDETSANDTTPSEETSQPAEETTSAPAEAPVEEPTEEPVEEVPESTPPESDPAEEPPEDSEGEGDGEEEDTDETVEGEVDVNGQGPEGEGPPGQEKKEE